MPPGPSRRSNSSLAPITSASTRVWLAAPSFNGLAAAQGPLKTFTLRGIKESPPSLHDVRLLTLEDTAESFNLVLELKLTAEEKKPLVAFMRQLVHAAAVRPHILSDGGCGMVC